jgi:hypothetical protein
LRTMAAFCRFWRITPAEYRALRFDEVDALATWMNEEIRRQRRR